MEDLGQDAKSNQPPTGKSQRRFWLGVFFVLFVLIGLIYTIYWLLISQFYETTDDAYVSGNTVQVMSQISGRVTKIFADETDLVQQGHIILGLDKIDAEIALQTAQTQLALAIRNTTQLFYNVAEQRANVAVQLANLEKIQGDLARRKPLAVERVISNETFAHAHYDTDAAAASLDLAKQQLAAAMALIANSTICDYPNVVQAIVQLRNAYLNFQRTTIYAPATGYIARRPVQVGQEITPATVLMVIVPIDQLWIDANFKETQLRHIRIGQPVRFTADAYGKGIVYHGTVVGLSPGTGSVFDVLPPQNATGNWIKIVQRLPVRIAIDPRDLALYPLRIGLSMRVSVNTHNRTGHVLSLVPSRKVIYQTKNYYEYIKDSNKLIEQIFKANTPSISYH